MMLVMALISVLSCYKRSEYLSIKLGNAEQKSFFITGSKSVTGIVCGGTKRQGKIRKGKYKTSHMSNH